MNTTKRKMPTELVIRAQWAERLWQAKGYDCAAEFMERGTCFACGLDGNERAHIVARAVGGHDGPENLHILCSACHKDSEYLEGGRYMAWLMRRSPVDRLMSEAMRCGFNPAVLIQSHG
ncbi:MAG: HNH endonuclease [Ramlibacter sp.]|nr:HNH endonuclease [Ramlibacter sp.]